MSKRGPKPKGKVKIEWSPDFAYAIGLLVTDGNVSKDGRHVSFVSIDLEQVENYMKCLNIHNKIGMSYSGRIRKPAYRIQFGDVRFIKFLRNIGIGSAKSLTIGPVEIPNTLFFHFLRGCFDGDGYSHNYLDPRWRSSFMFYIGFVSASPSLIHWLKRMISKLSGVRGHITRSYKKHICYQLKYSKYEAVKLAQDMYTDSECTCLMRKRLKVIESLAMMGKLSSEDRYLTNDARVAKLAIRTTLRW